MNKDICIIIPHKGIGDVIFHCSFIGSISEYHKRKVILFVNSSTKANLIYQNNKYVKKIFFIDLKRPQKIFYIFKIIKIIFELCHHNIDKIYYTGNSKWHKIAFKSLSIIKKISLKNIYVKNKYIVSHLKDFLRREKINDLNSYDIQIKSKLRYNFINKILSIKKPWVFLSIDTSEDQINIPNELLIKIIEKLKKKFNYIFVNTNQNNAYKTEFLKDRKIIKTSQFNILEILFIIKKSKLFIGNESGPAVLASLNCRKSIIFLNKNVRNETSKLPRMKKRKYLKISNIIKNNNIILNII